MSESGLYGIPKKQRASLSEIHVDKLGNQGSTNTSCVYYTRLFYSIGQDITYIKSTVFGDSFVINTAGIYGFTLKENGTASMNCAISRNASGTDLTGNPSGDSADKYGRCILLNSNIGDANGGFVTAIAQCYEGDIIRAHEVGALSGTGTVATSFRITRLS